MSAILKRAFTGLGIGTALFAAVAIAAPQGTAIAWQSPGQRGYEGQPGNQGGQHHNNNNHAPGLRGYEGQPGNQGG